MQTPPPFHEQPPTYSAPRRSNTGLIIGIVIGVLAICCGLPLGLVAYGVKNLGPAVFDTAGCAVSMSFLQRSAELYAKDHNGQLPSAATWQDDLKTYYRKLHDKPKNKDTGPINIPYMEDQALCVQSGKQTGIAINTDVAGKKLSDIKDPSGEILFFEVNQVGRNLSEKYVEKPKNQGPLIFGKHRRFFAISVNGHMGSTTVDVDTSDRNDN